jgi:hypothetical protein
MEDVKDTLIKAFGPQAAKQWLPTPKVEQEDPNEEGFHDISLISQIQKLYQPPQMNPQQTQQNGAAPTMSDQQTRWGQPQKGKSLVNKV